MRRGRFLIYKEDETVHVSQKNQDLGVNPGAISGGNRGELESYNLSIPRKTYLTRGRSVAHSWTGAVIHNDETFKEEDVCVRAEKIDRRRGA